MLGRNGCKSQHPQDKRLAFTTLWAFATRGERRPFADPLNPFGFRCKFGWAPTLCRPFGFSHCRTFSRPFENPLKSCCPPFEKSESGRGDCRAYGAVLLVYSTMGLSKDPYYAYRITRTVQYYSSTLYSTCPVGPLPDL